MLYTVLPSCYISALIYMKTRILLKECKYFIT